MGPSSTQNSSTSNTSGSQPAPGRRPATPSSFPSIKLFYMPEGRLSQTPDERCITYCTQSIHGRLEKRQPWCRSLCLRRVFAHEVRNIIGFKKHQNAQADGAAKYPLPAEGQIREKVPKETITVAGRREAQKRKVPDAATQYWEEGWYLWWSRSKWKSLEHMDLMSWDLANQTKWMEAQKKKMEEWNQRQKTIAAGKEPIALPASTRLRPPIPDESAAADLIRIPPGTPPLYRTIENYLEPTHRLMELLRESIEDGTQRQFAWRVWKTAFTTEPYRLVTIVCSRMWEMWNAGPPDENDGAPAS